MMATTEEKRAETQVCLLQEQIASSETALTRKPAEEFCGLLTDFRPVVSSLKYAGHIVLEESLPVSASKKPGTAR